MTDEQFLAHLTDRLAALPGVEAVTLGGSRAEGTHTPDSDWDLAVYYRHGFDPADLRAIGWPGEVFDLGAWGGGVFNGGAWLTVDGRRVDIHYRDLATVDRELTEAEAGRFHWEPLMFHLAGIPSYLLVAELAINSVLHGALPRPDYPRALRESAPPVWRERAALTLTYADNAYAARGHRTEVAGALATAAVQTAHAVLAARGTWVVNEKRMLNRAGLRGVDDIVGQLASQPQRLRDAIGQARELFDRAQ
ncbi:nucleotidyltransferase domain-containing protein [Nocardia cyriacigeorgica]|uniref:nucleotidyltransferase domain-containing protein n=1 Tax=Nocardia cyriacigeorgica TaxID=135487 RepID=UPI0013D6C76E|nr:nucleotidyltransferase domain-containing protein [Nocardia cyriacigeorgica]NEW29215.1 nucleotidyltransferase domain-containing protein [Nocardia cyriacigeorgica]